MQDIIAKFDDLIAKLTASAQAEANGKANPEVLRSFAASIDHFTNARVGLGGRPATITAKGLAELLHHTEQLLTFKRAASEPIVHWKDSLRAGVARDRGP